MTLFNAIKQDLRAAGIKTPDLEARLIFKEYTDLTDADLISGEVVLNPDQEKLIKAVVVRRIAGEPLSRIFGHREFWGLNFILSTATLDPRPDSETLIEAALEWRKTYLSKSIRILDLGTGTGCLLLTLLHEWKDASGIGVDRSLQACQTARLNAHALGLSDRCSFINGSWLDSIRGHFDLILSNPPYIPSQVVPNLSPEVRNHDPILALDGGQDGLTPYKILFPALKNHLETDGRAFFEIGVGQLPDIERLARDSHATLSRAYPDLGGIPRVVEISIGDK